MDHYTRQDVDHDQRYFPRWEVANKVVYKHEDGVNFHECLSRDISNTGLCLRSYEKIEANKKLLLTIELVDGVTIQAQGRVMWAKDNQKDCIVGVRFENISEQVQDMIFNCAFENQTKQFQEKWFEGT
jgi:c-di-GMP-binding flagellar brake protein YcgR